MMIYREILLSFFILFAFIFIFYPHLPNTRPERGEELVFSENSFMRERIHKCGFPRVRVPDNSDGFQVLSFASLTVLAPSSRIFFEFLDDFELVVTEVTFHNFGISFSESAHGSGTSSPLTGEFHSHSENPRSHVTNGGEFDLEFGFRRVRMLVENLEYKINSIPSLNL